MSILSLKTETIVTMGSNLENLYQTNINYLQDSMDLQTKNYEESKEIKGLLQKIFNQNKSLLDANNNQTTNHFTPLSAAPLNLKNAFYDFKQLDEVNSPFINESNYAPSSQYRSTNDFFQIKPPKRNMIETNDTLELSSQLYPLSSQSYQASSQSNTLSSELSAQLISKSNSATTSKKSRKEESSCNEEEKEGHDDDIRIIKKVKTEQNVKRNSAVTITPITPAESPKTQEAAQANKYNKEVLKQLKKYIPAEKLNEGMDKLAKMFPQQIDNIKG
jgi:hypothetical protein